MYLKSFLFSLGTSVFVLSSLATAHAAEPIEVLSSDKEPELKKLASDLKLVSGTVLATINGKSEEFMNTSETIQISEERIKAADPRAHDMLRKMNGKVVDTAVVRSIGPKLYVSIGAHGDIEKNGPNLHSKKKTSLKLDFTLDPETLQLGEKNRQIVYLAPGQESREGSVAKDYELKIDSITKLPKGALAIKGSFSATLTENPEGKALPKPIEVKGTFDVQRMGANDMTLKLIQGK